MDAIKLLLNSHELKNIKTHMQMFEAWKHWYITVLDTCELALNKLKQIMDVHDTIVFMSTTRTMVESSELRNIVYAYIQCVLKLFSTYDAYKKFKHDEYKNICYTELESLAADVKQYSSKENSTRLTISHNVLNLLAATIKICMDAFTAATTEDDKKMCILIATSLTNLQVKCTKKI